MPPAISHLRPVLACSAVEAALAFRTEPLGFEREWVRGERASDGGASGPA
jgi:hypothetical protein